jgi:hypothetical protein
VPRISPHPHQSSQDFNEANILSYFNNSIDFRTAAHLVDTQAAMRVVHTNCSLPSRSDNCSFAQFEALLNLADRTVCKCEDTRISIGNRCRQPSNSEAAATHSQHLVTQGNDGVTVFAVTPTYTRHTQKVDLTSLCYTIQQVPKLLWIVVEDSLQKTSLVSGVLERCKVCFLQNGKHLCIGRISHSFRYLYSETCVHV